jgi:hypothetical protein
MIIADLEQTQPMVHGAVAFGCLEVAAHYRFDSNQGRGENGRVK